jgi:hypothetical protein
MATTFGIVYATGSKMVRRVILPDHDDELLGGLHVGPGESMLVKPSGPSDIFTCQAHVKTATGVQPLDPRCAVVDNTNTVVAVILADPALDSHPAGALVSCYDPSINVGHTYSPSTKLFTSPQVVLAAIPSKGRATPTIIPPTVVSNLAVTA